MKNLHLIQYLALLLLFITHPSSAAKSSGYTPLIEKLSIPARVSTGISIQNGVFSDKTIVIDVLAEFLNLPTPALFSKFLDPNSLAAPDELQSLYDFYKKVPDLKFPNKDELLELLKLIIAMKDNVELLKLGKIGDPTASIQSIVSKLKSKSASLEKSIETTYFDTVGAQLKSIASSANSDRKVALLKLNEELNALINQLNLFKSYKTEFADFLTISKYSKELDPLLTVGKLTKDFNQKFKNNQVIKSQLKLLSNETLVVKTSMAGQQVHQGFIKKFSNLINLYSEMSGLRIEPIKFTSGFLNGIQDSEELKKDFDSAWFKNNFVDFSDLKNLLKPVMEFLPKVQSLHKLWKPLADDPSLQVTSRKLAGLLEGMSQSKISDKSMMDSFEKVIQCLGNLQPIKNQPDFTNFQNIYNFIESVGGGVKKYQNVVENVLKVYDQKTMDKVDAMKKPLDDIFDDTADDDVNKIWDQTKSNGDLSSIMAKLESTSKELKSVPTTTFSLFKKNYKYSSIQTVLNAFDGTNVVEAINCVQPTSVDSIIGILSFGEKTSELKKAEKDAKVAVVGLSQLKKLQEDTNKLIGEVKATKLSSESLVLKDFEKKISEEIGLGLRSIGSLDSIIKEEKSIQELTTADVTLKTAVAGIKGSDTVYNENILKELSSTVAAIKKFESKIPKSSELSDILKILKEVAVIGTVQIEYPELFRKIREELSKNSDPNLKAKAQHFNMVSTIDLNFARHKTRLMATPPALESFRNWLSSLEPGIISKLLDDVSGLQWYYILLICFGCLVVVVLVCYGVYLLSKKCCGKNKKKKRDSKDLESGTNHGKINKKSRTSGSNENSKANQSKGSKSKESMSTPTTPTSTVPQGSNYSKMTPKATSKPTYPKAVYEVQAEVNQHRQVVKERQKKHEDDTKSARFPLLPPILVRYFTSPPKQAPVQPSLPLKSVTYEPKGNGMVLFGTEYDEVESERGTIKKMGSAPEEPVFEKKKLTKADWAIIKNGGLGTDEESGNG